MELVLVLTWPRNVKDVSVNHAFVTQASQNSSQELEGIVQSRDNQFQLMSCHPGNLQSLPECVFCKKDFLVYLNHVKVIFL